MSDAEGEAAETQVWLEFTARCEYAPREQVHPLYDNYEEIIKMIMAMIKAPEKWLLPQSDKTVQEEEEAYGEPF